MNDDMQINANLQDWYWQLADRRIWSTKTAAFVPEKAAQVWAEAQGMERLPASPVDESGEHSEQGLRDALVFYGLPLGELVSVEQKIAQIDAETSAAIIAGFDYPVAGKTLRFSYDVNDQQNFGDTANVATLAQMGVPGLPATITWNGWEIHGDGSRVLHRLELTMQEFLGLYTQGALTHKATQMEIGSQRKAALYG